MQWLTPRQGEILKIAQQEGRAMVATLTERFGVSPQTIRKDLNVLCDLEKLQRIHGGAVAISNTVNLNYLSRREIATEGKEKIAVAIAKKIANGESLILNIGTTTEQVAYALRHHQNLMVITNNLNVATILSKSADIELIISGGMVRNSDGGITGEAAIDLIRQFKVDYAVIGASGIDVQGALLDFDYHEVRVTQVILAQARKKVLVADATKFERIAPVQIGHITDIDIFVTDKTPPLPVMRLCEDAGIEIIIGE